MSTIVSIHMKEALEKAKAIDDTLTANDFHSTCVSVEHSDGTRFFFTHAILLMEGPWWMVFTEHHGYHVFHEEDCVVREYQQLWNDHVRDEDIEAL